MAEVVLSVLAKILLSFANFFGDCSWAIIE